MEDINEKIVFHDAKNNLIDLGITIKQGKLSISGHCGNSAGQCQDSINPANQEQKKIIEIWNIWHLNDLTAGTPKQEEALKKFKKKSSDYDEKVKYLKSKKLYSDKGYKYGSAWLTRELPTGLSTELKALCETIRQQEEKRKEELNQNSELKDFAEDINPRIKALALSLDLSPAEAEQDITEESETEFNYSGINYFVGTEEEATERAKDYIDKDAWIDAIKSDRTTDSFEEWQEYVIQMDGFGSILNSWDGSEDTQDINGTTYYIIRM